MDLPIQENRRRATCARCVHKAETVQIRHRELGTARARVPQHGRETVVCLARSLWRTALPPHSLRHTTASSDSRALTTAVFGAFRAACADGHTRGLLNGLQGAEAVSALQQRQQQPGVLDQPMTSGLAQAMTVALATMCDLLTTTSYDPARKIYVGVAFELKHNDAEYFCLGGTVSKAMASAGAPGHPGFIDYSFPMLPVAEVQESIGNQKKEAFTRSKGRSWEEFELWWMQEVGPTEVPVFEGWRLHGGLWLYKETSTESVLPPSPHQHLRAVAA